MKKHLRGTEAHAKRKFEMAARREKQRSGVATIRYYRVAGENGANAYVYSGGGRITRMKKKGKMPTIAELLKGALK